MATGNDLSTSGELLESAGQFREKAASPEKQAEQAIVDELKECLKFAKSYYDFQYKSEAEELEFEGLDMWDKEARDARAAREDDDGTKIPAKPTISANLLDQNIQQVVSEARQARLAITVKPKNALANDKTGNRVKGLVRAIQVESGALEVRLWALERAAKVGRGGWLIAAEFASDEEFDCELREKRILDYSTVYWDPYGVNADRSDCEWCVITEVMSEAERKRRWPLKPIIVPDGAFDDEANDWFTIDPENKDLRRCRVATFYKVVRTKYSLGFHPKVGRGWIGEGPEGSQLKPLPDDAVLAIKARAPGTRMRTVDSLKVQISVCDGAQMLESTPWLGKLIPVIETIGKEYFIKGKRRWKGIIANAMELLSAINVLLSAATELAALMPRNPYVMAAGQDEGFEDEWDDLTVKNLTRVHFNQKDVNGDEAQAPIRQPIELQVNGLLLLLRMMHEMYHAVTGSVAPQLRAVNPYDRSGKAIEALQRQGAAGTSNYLDNMATIAMLYEGRVLLDSIPNYYDNPGRVISVIGDESDEDTLIMIKRPFTRNKDGVPEPVPCPTCKGAGTVPKRHPYNPFILAPAECPDCEGTTFATRETMPPMYEDREVEYVDFGNGAEYKVVAAVDRDFQARQEEALDGMSALAKAAPEMVPVYADLWVRAMGFSGSTEIADRIKSRMPEGDEDLKDIPPQLLGKFMALKQQHEQAIQALQQAHQMLETDAFKAASAKDVALIKGAVEEKIAKLKNQGEIIKMNASGQADERLEVLRGKIELMREESEFRHDVLLQLLKERGEKEVERHSVGLHAAAASKAADEAQIGEATADQRKFVLDEASATTAHAREESSASRAHQREESSAEKAHQRDEVSAERAHAREETSAEAAARRERQAAKDEGGK